VSGAIGSVPELYEPGARIIYISAKERCKRPDGSSMTRILKASGTVERATETLVELESGQKVRKDHVCGFDHRREGQARYRVVLHHVESHCRLPVMILAASHEGARAGAQLRADRLFGEGSWTVGGSTRLTDYGV
jgi:hypothetical protein